MPEPLQNSKSAFYLFLRQMLPDDTRRKIENITARAVIEGSQDHCTTIRNFLCSPFATSTTAKTDFEVKQSSKKSKQTPDRIL